MQKSLTSPAQEIVSPRLIIRKLQHMDTPLFINFTIDLAVKTRNPSPVSDNVIKICHEGQDFLN